MPKLTPADEIPAQRIDWGLYVDGQWRTFYQDQDYPGRTSRLLYESACKYAQRHGVGFQGRVQRDRVFVQLWKKEGTDGEHTEGTEA